MSKCIEKLVQEHKDKSGKTYTVLTNSVKLSDYNSTPLNLKLSGKLTDHLLKNGRYGFDSYITI